MVATADRRSLHPVHAALLAGTVPWFLAVLLCDLAYASTYQIQWKNFSSWLLIGGLVFGGFALLWSVVAMAARRSRGRWPLLAVLLLLASWVLGFLNALVHAKDAWASMPASLILSIAVAILAAGALAVGLIPRRWGLA